MSDNPVMRYLRETRAELSKVTWPSWPDARNLTIIVLITVIISSAVLGTFDYLFAELFSFIIGAR
jgi:preprotein translocase subunit SecE